MLVENEKNEMKYNFAADVLNNSTTVRSQN